MPRYLTVFLLAGVLGWTGCAEQAQLRRTFASPYKPTNLHQRAATLPATLRRVAVLPVTVNDQDQDARTGVQNLEPVLVAELRKKGAFEVVPVTREQLRVWTGQPSFRQSEVLPVGLLGQLREQTGCDGVLFSHLSVYRPYPPLAVGWHLALVTSEDRVTEWSVDEVFDAGSPEVIKAAQSYFRGQLNQPSVELDSTGVLTSPRRFGQYSAAAALGTLPTR